MLCVFVLCSVLLSSCVLCVVYCGVLCVFIGCVCGLFCLSHVGVYVARVLLCVILYTVVTRVIFYLVCCVGCLSLFRLVVYVLLCVV